MHDRAGCGYNDSVTTQADDIHQKQKAESMTKRLTKQMTNRMTDSTIANSLHHLVHAALLMGTQRNLPNNSRGNPRKPCRTLAEPSSKSLGPGQIELEEGRHDT